MAAQRPGQDFQPPEEWSYILETPARSAWPGGEFGEKYRCGPMWVSARVMDDTLLVGEPLVVELRVEGAVKADGAGELTGRFALGRDVHLYITPKDRRNGLPFEYQIKAGTGFSPRTTLRLPYGEQRERQLVAIFDPDSPNGAIFPAAGEYEVMITFDCESELNERIAGSEEAIIPLGAFTVSVEMPQREDPNLPALNQLASDFRNFLALQETIARPQHEELLRALLGHAENTVYRPWALLSLGSYLILDVDSPGRVREGIELLQTLRREYPDHWTAGVAFQRELRAYFALQDVETAKNTFLEGWMDPYLIQVLEPRNAERQTFAFRMDPIPPENDWMVYTDPWRSMLPERPRPVPPELREPTQTTVTNQAEIQQIIDAMAAQGYRLRQ